MTLVQGKIREWGGSLGIVIPKQKAKEAGLTRGLEVAIDIAKINPLEKAFGSLKSWKINAQKVKDELRKEWSKW